MRLVRSFIDAAGFRGAAVSIGNFDGVHRGHQRMLGTLVEEAASRGVPSLVMTFDPHPIALLAPEKAPPSLSTLERKAELIGRLGVDCLLGYPTDRALLGLTAREFFNEIIRGHLMAAGLVEGPNFQFGKARGGDVNTLREYCGAEEMFLRIVEPVAEPDGTMFSSSRVREAVSAGDIGWATKLLGRPYRITGVVEHGDARGRTLGFPTANLGGIATLLPPPGVYAGRCEVNGTTHAAAVHVGGNPTFGQDALKVEVHVLDFNGDLYGRPLAVDFAASVRGVVKFEDADALKAQLQQDLSVVREIIST